MHKSSYMEIRPFVH